MFFLNLARGNILLIKWKQMNIRHRIPGLITLLLLIISSQIFAQRGRQTIPLSNHPWKAWMDTEAKWKEDKLYLPSEFDLSIMPVNPPTCGWAEMYESEGNATSLPSSIEELFSNGINSWTYHGVSWFFTTVTVPENREGKKMILEVEKARLRMEIYVNEKLSGYDLVAETPYAVDITAKLVPGNENRIAIRLTNPGGQRGWEDFPGIRWGGYMLPASHDFTGLGHVNLVKRDSLFIENIFIKNLLPAGSRKISLQTEVYNPGKKAKKVNFSLEISSKENMEVIFTSRWVEELPAGMNTVNKILTVSKAKLWDTDSPYLYNCKVQVTDGTLQDERAEDFGFRTFEIKENNGDPNFYVNDKRVRLRSATDWGYYALTGFYATPGMALKSVQAARDIGHNAINFHRRIGEPLVMEYADKLGLYIYEEPGGFHAGGQGYLIPDNTFAAEIMMEKIRRMVRRDRNHPSLIWYTLCNEDNYFNPLRKKALFEINRLDNSRMIANSSGWGNIEYIRPYESFLRNDFIDDHTVESDSRFRESEFYSHRPINDTCLMYWGEVRCYTGPPNWFAIVENSPHTSSERPGYDMNIYRPLHEKINQFFYSYDFPGTGSGRITSPADLTIQAGRGLMYSDGRLGQIIMSHNGNDGYAINGWSGGPQLPDAWESAITDEGRNLKGPASDYNYWTRKNQLAIFRQNGKYFEPGDTARFGIHLINDGIIPGGNYTLKLILTDGSGEKVLNMAERNIHINGAEEYAQELLDSIPVVMQDEWKAGYITLHGYLTSGIDTFSRGTEQVLLKNRPSYQARFSGIKGLVFNWAEAKRAVEAARGRISEYSPDEGPVDYILAGPVFKWDGHVYKGNIRQTPPDTFLLPDKYMEDILRRVREEGTRLIIRMDDYWGLYLFEKGILSELPNEWGGWQTGHWNGNGWGYLDYFCGDQPIPSGPTIGTNSWEIPGSPYGFYPFKSEYSPKVFGTWFARPDKILVLNGTLKYGKGTIILNSAYPVNDTDVFNDLLFYNLLLM